MSDGLKLITSIVENGSTTTFRLLERSMFVDDSELLAFDTAQRHYLRHAEFPTIATLEEETRLRLPDTPEIVDYYLDKVHDRTMFNAVRPVFADLRQALIAGESEGVRENAAQLTTAVRTNVRQNDLMTMEAVGEDVMANYHRNHMQSGMSGVATGFSHLDNETGGYQNSDLVMWVARPGIGKTHLLIHQARAAFMQGKSILFVSMEMALAQIGYRYFAQVSGINPDMIRKGKLSTFAERRLDETIMSLDDSNRFHLYAGNMQKQTEDLDMLIQELSPDIIYIDGMYLMSPRNDKGRGKGGRFERAAYLVDDLKEMTITRDRPIVATTQFGRAADKGGKGGSLENIGYTDAIGTHSSLVLGIKMCDPVMVDKYLDERGDTRETKMTFPYRVIETMKGREGESGEFAINFKLGPTDFSRTSLTEAYASLPDAGPVTNSTLDLVERP